MICSCCGNLLVEDRFMEWTARWRCLNCSGVKGSVRVQSKMEREDKGFSAEPDYCDEEFILALNHSSDRI